jgi:hypothetical protein
MTLGEKKLALSQLIGERFADRSLTRDQRIAQALCRDRGIDWVPTEPGAVAKVETGILEINGERIAATRRLCPRAGSRLYLRLLDVGLPGAAGPGFSFVEKEIEMPSPAESRRQAWLDEALFYVDVQPELAASGFRIPRCMLVYAHDDGRYSLCLEQIRDFERPASLAERQSASRGLGQLAAVACAQGVGARPWLTRRPLSSAPAPGIVAERLRRLESVEGLDHDILESYERVPGILERAADVQREFATTIGHNDTHWGNVLIDPHGSICILDWARVSRGLIGEDLCKLFQPWIYSQTRISTMEEMAEVERALLDSYASGVKEILPACDKEHIRLNYYLRSIMHSLSRLSGRNRSMNKFLALARDDTASAARLAMYYAYTSRKIGACGAMV